jgi:hypothetical protein
LILSLSQSLSISPIASPRNYRDSLHDPKDSLSICVLFIFQTFERGLWVGCSFCGFVNVYIGMKSDKIIVCPFIYNDAEGNKGGVNLRGPFHHASDHQKEIDDTDPPSSY